MKETVSDQELLIHIQRAGNMQPRFLEELQQVKESYPGLISALVDVWEEYDISRLLRHGA